MQDFLVALCLVLVIEGVLYALFPDGLKKMIATALVTPTPQLRIFGLVMAIIGVILVALIRS